MRPKPLFLPPPLPLLLLLLLPGAAAPPPPPLGLLLGTDGSPRIGCFAPKRFSGATFELLGPGGGDPVRSLRAQPQRHSVEFELDGAAAAAVRCYWCRYRSYNGSEWETSEISEGIAMNGSADSGCGVPGSGSSAPLPRSEPGGSAAAPRAPRLLPVLVLVLLAAA